MNVELSPEAYELVRAEARARYASAVTDGWRNRLDGVRQKYDTNLHGAGAELAVSRYLGLPWTATVGSNAIADVGEWVQVRCRIPTPDWPEPELFVHEQDPVTHAYVLAVPRFVYELVGWTWGHQAKIAGRPAGRPQRNGLQSLAVSREELLPVELLHAATEAWRAE